MRRDAAAAAVADDAVVDVVVDVVIDDGDSDAQLLTAWAATTCSSSLLELDAAGDISLLAIDAKPTPGESRCG